MRVPFLLFLLSIFGVSATIVTPAWQDLLLLSGSCVLASLILLLRAALCSGKVTAAVVLDGSNVMHWQGGTPRLETLQAVISDLKRKGFSPGVIFDANAGYLLSGSYKHDAALAKTLGLPRDRVMVVPKGTPADPTILMAARDLGARIVTNDHYRDWVEDYPEIKTPKHLIKGDFRDGQLWLDV